MEKKYEIMLYYGYENNESGIYHAFEAVGPNEDIDDDEMGAQLAGALDLDADDSRFAFNAMHIKLPESVVERIKADAVKEYLETHGQ